MDRAEYRKLIGKITNRAESQRDAKALADAFELVKAYDEETKLSVFDDDGSELTLNQSLGDRIGDDVVYFHCLSKAVDASREIVMVKCD